MWLLFKIENSQTNFKLVEERYQVFQWYFLPNTYWLWCCQIITHRLLRSCHQSVRNLSRTFSNQKSAKPKFCHNCLKNRRKIALHGWHFISHFFHVSQICVSTLEGENHRICIGLVLQTETWSCCAWQFGVLSNVTIPYICLPLA